MGLPMTTAQFQAWQQAHPQIKVIEPGGRGPAPPRRAPKVVPPGPLAILFGAIQDLAQAHGWTERYTYNTTGPDAGLHLMLVREVVLCAEVTATTLSPGQQEWLDAVQQTGQVETYHWTPASLPEIRARLSQPRGAHG